MNSDTNKFEPLHLEALGIDESAPFGTKLAALANQLEQKGNLPAGSLLRPDGTPVPEHWSVFTVGD